MEKEKFKKINSAKKDPVISLIFGFILVAILIMIPYFAISHHNSAEKLKNKETDQKVSAILSESSNYAYINDLRAYYSNISMKAYGQYKIGSNKSNNVQDNDSLYRPSSISGNNLSEVNYFKYNNNIYVRVIYNIHNLKISSVRKVTKQQLANFIQYDKYQSDFSHEFDKGNINIATKNKINDMMSQYSYLYN